MPARKNPVNLMTMKLIITSKLITSYSLISYLVNDYHSILPFSVQEEKAIMNNTKRTRNMQIMDLPDPVIGSDTII